MPNQPISECQDATIASVAEPDNLKPLLWENVEKLMIARWGKANQAQLSARAGNFSPQTALRMKEQATDLGIDVVAGAAFALSVKPWQLLVPDMDPKNMPRLERKPMSPEAVDLAATLDRISDPARRQQAYATALMVIALAADSTGSAPPPPRAP